jgi:hypothetical protein
MAVARPACPGCRRRDQRIAELEAEIRSCANKRNKTSVTVFSGVSWTTENEKPPCFSGFSRLVFLMGLPG